MSTAKHIHDIKEADLGLDDGIDIDLSRLRPPGDLRIWAFAAGVAAAVMGGIGLYQTPYSYDRVSYGQDWVNERLKDNAASGGSVAIERAQVSLSGDQPALLAQVTDGDRWIDVAVSGHMKLDSKSWTVTIAEPTTRVSEVRRDRPSSSERAASFVPDMAGKIDGEWSESQRVASAVQNGVSWLTGVVASAASGDFVADMQFPGQAKHAVWDLPIIKIPDADRAMLARGSIAGVDLIDGQIVVEAEFWDLNFLAVASIVLLAGGVLLVGSLIYSPSFLSE